MGGMEFSSRQGLTEALPGLVPFTLFGTASSFS